MAAHAGRFRDVALCLFFLTLLGTRLRWQAQDSYRKVVPQAPLVEAPPVKARIAETSASPEPPLNIAATRAETPVLGDVVGADAFTRPLPFNVLVAAVMEPWLNVSVVAADPGTNNCHGRDIHWFYLAGHYRTFIDNLPNVGSFMQTSGKGCWAQVIYTLSEVDSTPRRYHTTDVVKDLRNISSSTTGLFAYLVVSRNAAPRPDILPGVVRVAALVARHHGLTQSPTDVITISRPDILFSHGFDYAQLQTYARHASPFILFTQHSPVFSYNDPSELFIVGTRAAFEDLCVSSCATQDQIRGQCANESGCVSKGCGYYGSKWIVVGGERGFDACFMPPTFKIQLHRPFGGLAQAVGGMHALVVGPRTVVRPAPLRFLDGLRCLRDFGVCDCAAIMCGSFAAMFKSATMPPGGLLPQVFQHDFGFIEEAFSRGVFNELDEDADGRLTAAEQNSSFARLGGNFSSLRPLVDAACPTTIVAENVTFERKIFCNPSKTIVRKGHGMYITAPGALVPRRPRL